ncbi:hypothetical protein J4430_02635 [Candidatus Woesearchaeota archaeon]|nr:hypothetical protein [Candidatus Woesearchaeota archaeon]
MKNIVVAPVGDNLDAIFVGLKEFPTDRIILISPPKRIDDANKLKKEIEKFKIQVQIKEIKGEVWEEMFRAVSKIRSEEGDKNIIVNVATGDRETQCAATSAAFVNGLKAFSVAENQVMLLPVLKFSYYKILTERKLNILKLLYEDGCCASLEELSRKAKMSLPLVSYHVNGTIKSEGLKQLGLVDVQQKRGKLDIKISTLGKLLIKGYVT